MVLAVALTGLAQAATFVLGGNILDVGVSDSGGLIDDNFTAGILYKPMLPADYLTPGTPFEFYSIGESGAWNSAGYSTGNTFGTVSTNTSVPPTLSANTVSGAFFLGGATLIYTQNVFFDVNASAINFSVDILNVGNTPTNQLVYARGLDPDQDINLGGGFATLNSIPAANRVRAVGPLSNLYIDIVDLTGGGVPTVDQWWDQNPYNLLVPHNDGNGDFTINMAWAIPSLDPGRSYEIDFQYVVGVVPIPGSLLLLGTGILGLLGAGGVRLRKK